VRILRNLLLGLVLVLLAYFGIRGLIHALASAETKIRWTIENMVEGFNDSKMNPVIGGIAENFVDKTSDVKREDLRSILVWMFLNETDDRHAFLWSAVFDKQTLSVKLGLDKHSADAACSVRFFRRRGEQNELVWDAHVAGTLALGEDGWQWTALTQANHAQRRR